MNKVVIGIGSNCGDREHYLNLAMSKLELLLMNSQFSSVYETKAVGMEEGHDQDFLNMVCAGYTELSAPDFLNRLIQIETDLGRVRVVSENHLSRTIDLDLLFFNDEVIEFANLIVPHPRIQERSFVIYPLMDLMPDFIIPGVGKSIRECLSGLKELSEIKRYENEA